MYFGQSRGAVRKRIAVKKITPAGGRKAPRRPERLPLSPIGNTAKPPRTLASWLRAWEAYKASNRHDDVNGGRA